LRIPKPFAEETRLEENREVEISVRGGKLIVEAVEPDVTLKALLDQVTPENRHGEVSTGKRVGKEVW
jgi:antitoxin component of MazEF toxin-antitoxin module